MSQIQMFEPTKREIQLRPYQVEAGEKVAAEWEKGVLSTQITMATGTGKTEVLLSILANERKAGRMTRALILAHREQLVRQPRNRIAENWSGQLPPAGIVMGVTDEVTNDVICATYQTLLSERRIARLLAHGAFSHVVIDECHHRENESYDTILKTLVGENPNLRILGVTATPKPGNGGFQSTAYKLSIKRAVQELKCLVPPIGLGVGLKIDLGKIKITGDDFNDDELATVMEASHSERIIYETWKKHASDRPTIAFTVSVKHAEMLADYFVAQGVSATFVSGETPKNIRSAIEGRYKSGELNVVFNCNVWAEGSDFPKTSAVMMCRPTLSKTYYLQAVGRGLRLADGKSDCLIIDFVPDSDRNLISCGDILEGKKKHTGATKKAIEDGVLLSVDTLMEQHELGTDEDLPDIVVKILDLLASKSQYKWMFDGKVSTCSLDKDSNISIVHPQVDRIAKADAIRGTALWNNSCELAYQAISSYQVFIVKSGTVELLHRSTDYDSAHYAAESYIEANGVYSGKGASWRKQPPSEKLCDFARRMGVYDPTLRAGDLSQRITHKICKSALQRNKIIVI